MFDSPFIIPVVAIVCWAFVTMIKVRHGVGRHGWRHDPSNIETPPMFRKMFEKEMSDRDSEIQQLRERVEVLEKIVTDGHKSSSLADEIERLRDKA